MRGLMEQLSGQFIVAIGAVVAALIAGWFSYFNLVTAKESKISEFRQQWIDALREDISIYTSRIRAIFALSNHLDSSDGEQLKDKAELVQLRSQLHVEALAAYNAIHLRINKNETDDKAKKINDAFINIIDETQENAEMGEEHEVAACLQEIVDKAAPVLKHEWKRVRDGERSYRNAKIISWAIIVVAIVLFLVIAYRLPSKTAAPAANNQSTNKQAVPTYSRQEIRSGK